MRSLSPSVTMTVNGDPFGSILDRLDAFTAQVRGAEKSAATMATRTTRASYKRLRPLAAPRAGRKGTGAMARSANWKPLQGGRVAFNYVGMNRDNPHWIIQEIGTGQSAVVRAGGKSHKVGRPTKGASYVRTVKSQKGRPISGALVWARGGRYVPPITGRVGNDNLALRSRVQGAPHVRGRSLPKLVIRREIKGQHFVQKGGEAGFREYRESVRAAARQQLKRRVR